MAIITAWDTETTGLLNYKRPLSDPSQPHLVQLAMIMVDSETRAPIKKISVIVRPDIPISPEVSKIHGVTDEMATKFGIMPKSAFMLFMHFVRRSDILVAHNKDYDMKIMKIEALRRDPEVDPFLGKFHDCTMAMSENIVRMPPTAKMIAAGMGKKFKAPKLSECYRHFFGEELIGAHDALVDAEGCLRVYFHLLDMEKKNATPETGQST